MVKTFRLPHIHIDSGVLHPSAPGEVRFLFHPAKGYIVAEAVADAHDWIIIPDLGDWKPHLGHFRVSEPKRYLRYLTWELLSLGDQVIYQTVDRLVNGYIYAAIEARLGPVPVGLAEHNYASVVQWGGQVAVIGEVKKLDPPLKIWRPGWSRWVTVRETGPYLDLRAWEVPGWRETRCTVPLYVFANSPEEAQCRAAAEPIDAVLCEKTAYLRRLAGISWPAPIEIVAGSEPPTLAGEPGYWTTARGEKIRYPKAYARKAGWRSIEYRKSTQRVIVGIDWLRSQPDVDGAFHAGPQVLETIAHSALPHALRPRQEGVYSYVARYTVGETTGYLLYLGGTMYHWGAPMAIVRKAKDYRISLVPDDTIQTLRQEGLDQLADIADRHYNGAFYARGLPRGLYRRIVAAFRTSDGRIIAVDGTYTCYRHIADDIWDSMGYMDYAEMDDAEMDDAEMDDAEKVPTFNTPAGIVTVEPPIRLNGVTLTRDQCFSLWEKTSG